MWEGTLVSRHRRAEVAPTLKNKKAPANFFASALNLRTNDGVYRFSVVVVVVVSFSTTVGLLSTILRTIMRSPSRT